MDFAAVILTHINWKKRFLVHLEGKEKLDPKVVERDDVCELGKWIHSSNEFAGTPDLEQLKAKHAHFHKVAADIVRRSATLPPEQARKLVELESAYGKASSECVNAIAQVRDRVAAPQAR